MEMRTKVNGKRKVKMAILLGMSEESKSKDIKERFLGNSLRILAYILIFYGIGGLILGKVGFWHSPPMDTFYYAFAFGLYLDVRVELRELRKERRKKE